MLHTTPPKHHLEEELLACLAAENPVAKFVIDEGNDGLWYWDLKAPDNLWISDDFWHALHFDPAEQPHTRQTVLDVVLDEDLSKAASLSIDELATSAHGYDQVLRFANKEGGITHFRCRGMITRDSDGTPHRMLGVLRDLTSTSSVEAFKDAAISGQKRNGENRINSDLQHFIYSMSHDMASPLQTTSSALVEVQHAISDGNLQDARELTEMCDASIKRMLVLLSDMRSYFLHAECTDDSFQPVSCSEAATAVCNDLRSLIEEKQATIEIDCKHHIIAQPSQLRVVLQNFIQNAIKFGSLNGPVTVKIKTEDLPKAGIIRLSVSDNGPGIPPHQLSGVFQPFTRLHLRRDVPGSGLGLSICRKIAENHGAEIGAEALVDGGSRFYLDIVGRQSS